MQPCIMYPQCVDVDHRRHSQAIYHQKEHFHLSICQKQMDNGLKNDLVDSHKCLDTVDDAHKPLYCCLHTWYSEYNLPFFLLDLLYKPGHHGTTALLMRSTKVKIAKALPQSATTSCWQDIWHVDLLSKQGCCLLLLSAEVRDSGLVVPVEVNCAIRTRRRKSYWLRSYLQNKRGCYCA